MEAKALTLKKRIDEKLLILNPLGIRCWFQLHTEQCPIFWKSSCWQFQGRWLSKIDSELPRPYLVTIWHLGHRITEPSTSLLKNGSGMSLLCLRSELTEYKIQKRNTLPGSQKQWKIFTHLRAIKFLHTLGKCCLWYRSMLVLFGSEWCLEGS